MTAISPRQLDAIAAFLETSRDYLDIAGSIRLRWPPAPGSGRRDAAAGSRSAKPASARRQQLTKPGTRAAPRLERDAGRKPQPKTPGA